MEPLGATDGSVEAAWDHVRDAWREDVVEVTQRARADDDAMGRHLCGLLSLAGRRRPARPRVHRCSTCSGAASNRTRWAPASSSASAARSAPSRSMCVNFESDGRRQYMKVKDRAFARPTRRKPPRGWPTATIRDNAERRAHGSGGAARRPVLADRQRDLVRQERLRPRDRRAQDRRVCQGDAAADPAIRLIAWGDSGWAGRMAEVAGEHVQYLAFHHMFDPDDPRAAGAARRAVPPRSGCHVGTADEGVGD